MYNSTTLYYDGLDITIKLLQVSIIPCELVISNIELDETSETYSFCCCSRTVCKSGCMVDIFTLNTTAGFIRDPRNTQLGTTVKCIQVYAVNIKRGGSYVH